MKILKILFIALLGLITFSCEDDDDDMMNPGPTGDEMVYELGSRDVQGMSGTATFVKNDDQSTTIILELQGAVDGDSYPAHIHDNTAVEGGGIAVSLEPVEGSNGRSEITISELDNGQAITYEELLQYDGYINVHKSANDLATIVAQGDIGQNMLTGEFRLYQLGEKDVDGVNGSARFEERMNGEALATLELNNSTRSEDSPAHIHMNTAAEGGAILFTFNAVDADTDMSMTNVAELDDGSAFGYDDLLNVDGYINVHQSANDLATLLAQADIGQNELTGESKVYVLSEKDVDGIEGTATFMERLNGEALAVLDLENTPQDGEHPAHIHRNTAADGGPIALTFNPVIGATGISHTNISAIDDGTTIGYDQILDFNGYINVHLSAEDLATIVAQGNIGVNE
ncbi:MAG TPA: CHRD domain-containing protein [Saprospiraceae bacterium]|nr:CHRD domain-containing protein [Saprospiraceae bacterium]